MNIQMPMNPNTPRLPFEIDPALLAKVMGGCGGGGGGDEGGGSGSGGKKKKGQSS